MNHAAAVFGHKVIGPPPYLQSRVLSSSAGTQTGATQIDTLVPKRNATGSSCADTWSRELKADTRLIGVCNNVTVTATFNQPFAQNSVSMYLWNGTDTPKITLTPISGQQNHILTGTITAQALAHTKVGVYPLAVSCTGPNPLAPHVDGNPRTIAWYDPVTTNSYRAYEQGPDTSHRVFAARTFSAGFASSPEASRG